MSGSSLLRHPYHIIDPSPWPLFGAIGALSVAFGFISSFLYASYRLIAFLVGIFFVLQVMYFWWKDVIRESSYLGAHVNRVQNGLKYGMILFILSEVMFFFTLFWAFFDNSLAPVMQVGDCWPPIEIQPVNPMTVPLINTLLLVTSGFALTWSHHALVFGRKWEAIIGLIVTLVLGITFTLLQVIEYLEGTFDISDSIYGTVFYITTGFHGFHVLIGTIFLMCCGWRLYNNQFTTEHHFGFEAAAWYWHFVDVVWLFVFVVIYIWGSTSVNM